MVCCVYCPLGYLGKPQIRIRALIIAFLSNGQMVKEVVGLDVGPKLKEFVVGVIIKLKELDYTWSTKYVHHFLPNNWQSKEGMRYGRC